MRRNTKRLLSCSREEKVEITADFPAGVIGDTAHNLEAAAGGENYEHTTIPWICCGR